MKGELNYKTKEKAGKQYPVIPVDKSENSSKVESDKNRDTLVFLEDRRKKYIDETIDTPDRYLSRYHYDSKNLDKYLELCPHCRKPNLYPYRKVVIDSALNYLEEKEEQRGRHLNRSRFVGLTAGLLLVSAGLYYLLFHVLSGVRV
jgi:Flp pilus assembly protein TadB